MSGKDVALERQPVPTSTRSAQPISDAVLNTGQPVEPRHQTPAVFGAIPQALIKFTATIRHHGNSPKLRIRLLKMSADPGLSP